MEVRMDEIYGDVLHGIRMESYPCGGEKKGLCVMGVLDSERGCEIKSEMLQWLQGEYDVCCVVQDVPGVLYEYPALRFAQWMCIECGHRDVLYVHTKGAACARKSQRMIRQMWKCQFTGRMAEGYREMLGEYDVVCPLRGFNNETWYNGMFISRRGFVKTGTIMQSKDRYSYQRMFRDVQVRGMLVDGIDAVKLDAYMMTHRFSESGVELCPDFGMAIEY